MKVIHVLKKIEQIDEDIKELRKMEKAVQRNKSFTTPIFMTIEKQINLMLGDRIKLLELTIANPPEQFAKEFDAPVEGKIAKPLKRGQKKGLDKPAAKKAPESSAKGKQRSASKESAGSQEIPMMTQDMIDSRFSSLKNDSEKKQVSDKGLLVSKETSKKDDNDVKLLDIALEKGTLNKEEIDKERKRVRFFRNNFPGGEY